jgi:hypothetical protein
MDLIPLKCERCGAPSVADRVIEIARAGERGSRRELRGHCAKHLRGERLEGFLLYPGAEAEILAADCRFCRQRFALGSGGEALSCCRACYYSGETHAEQPRIAALLEQLRALGAEASVWHTGGGCFGIGATLKSGTLLFCTAEGDATLPEPGERWTVGIYASEEAFADGDEPLMDLSPATDEEILAAARQEA